MAKKNLIFKLLPLFFFFWVLAISSCKKNDISESTTSALSDRENHPTAGDYRSNGFSILYSYVTSNANPTSRLFSYSPSLIANSFVQDFSGAISNPSFQAYRAETNELIGTLHWSNIYSWNAVLNYNLKNSTVNQSDIFTPELWNASSEKIVNQIVKLDEEKKQLYYLEGENGQVGFKTLTKCNYDGGGKTVLINSTNHDILQVVVADGIVYYVSRTHNALMRRTPDKQTITLIKNLNLAGASIVDSIQMNYNKNYHLVRMKQPTVDQRRMCLLTVDPTSKKIFWIRNSNGFISNKETGNLYDKIRPSLVCTNIDGTGLTTLIAQTSFFNGDKAPQTNSNKRYTLQRGNLATDASGAKVYVAYEVLENNPTAFYDGHSFDYPYLKTNVSMWQCRYNGGSVSFFLQPNNTGFQNPTYWKNAKVYFKNFPNNTIPADHPVYKGSLESFVVTKDNDLY